MFLEAIASLDPGLLVTQSVSHSLTQWQGHLLRCSGQLKIPSIHIILVHLVHPDLQACFNIKIRFIYLLNRNPNSIYKDEPRVPCPQDTFLMSPSVGLSFNCCGKKVKKRTRYVTITKDQFHKILNFVCLLSCCRLCFPLILLHRWRVEDLEWVHQKDDWRRVWASRDHELQLLLHIKQEYKFWIGPIR